MGSGCRSPSVAARSASSRCAHNLESIVSRHFSSSAWVWVFVCSEFLVSVVCRPRFVGACPLCTRRFPTSFAASCALNAAAEENSEHCQKPVVGACALDEIEI